MEETIQVAETDTLAIEGYRGEPVPNRFLRQDAGTDHLALLLPGMGYTLDMPLFYYAENLLTESGADLLRVEYAYAGRAGFRTATEEEWLDWLLTDATAAFRAGTSQRGYRRLTLVGKSLGTLAMGHLLTTAAVPPGATRAVWLTPLLQEERLREAIGRFAGPSLFAIGTADSVYDPAALDALRGATLGEAVVIEGADHGLDVPGDPVASVQGLERVVRAIRDFLLP